VMTVRVSLMCKLYVHKTLQKGYHYWHAWRHSVKGGGGQEDYGHREGWVPLSPIFRAKRSSQDEASSTTNRYIDRCTFEQKLLLARGAGHQHNNCFGFLTLLQLLPAAISNTFERNFALQRFISRLTEGPYWNPPQASLIQFILHTIFF
jgi:hypothetical protein